ANLVLRNSRLDNNRAESNGGLFYTKNGKSIITISSANISNASLTNDSMEGSLAYNAEVHLYQVTVNMTGSHTGIAFANSRVSADWSTFIGGKPRGNSSRSGIFYNSEVTLNRVLIKGSRANLQGVGIFDTCRIYVDHSIFHGNEEDGGNAPNAIARNTSGNILNSVFLNNGGSQDLPDNTAITVSHSSAAPNRGIAAANGNILTVNPAFINPAAGDYRVSFNSPLIDKGTQVYSGDIYDATDIGLYEYQDTHFSHYAPLPETGSIATSQSITIRIRNNKRRIELTDGNIILRINDIRYPLATLNITVTDNTLAAAVDPTDFYITFTPSPNFHYGSVITVDLTVSSGVPAETVRRIYNLYTEKPQNIYVSSSGNDGYNDGAPDRPLRTIARAMELASDDTKIFLSGEVFAEDVIWPNKKNISIAGTWNTTISGNIDLTALPPAVSGNIARIILNGQLTNSGLLSIDTLLSTSNAAAGLVNNSGAQIYMQNSVLANKGTALSNAGGLKIIYSNIVSNNTALENTGSAEIINSIMYKNNTLATGSFSDINNLTGDPLFVDDSFLAIAFNSPAVDAAADSVQVSLDYRELPRPEHHLPDIGAYESDKPNLILISPQEKDAVPVTLSWEFSVVENPDKISTENIKIRLVTDNQTQTISVNYTATATGYTLHALPRPLLDTNTTYDLIVTAENNSGNIVEISVNLHTEPDITELFVSTQNHALGEVGHADYPFTSIQKALDYIVRKKLPQATLNIAEAVYKERLTLPNNPGLSQNIHILGNASTLNAEAAGRGFTIGANYRITMQNFSLINGRANNNTGGAIQNNGAELLLEEVYFSDNQANDDGGAIYNTGEIILRYSAFTGNGTSDTGGAIYNTGKMRLEQVIFENNSAEFSGGGIYNNGGHLYGIEIKALNNRSKSTGGFLYSFRDSAATLENSLLRNNQASTAGGGIYNRGAITINNSIFDYNTLTGGSGSSTSGGGAIYNSGNDDGNMLNIYQSSFVSNDAGTARGGAIFNYGNGSSAKISIYNSLFVLNKSSDSSAIQGNMASAMPGKLLNSYPSVANGPTDPEHTLLNNVALYDYTPLAGSPLIDTGLDLSAVAGIVTSNDYAGKPRPMGGGYEIGALEHKVSILIPPGYYAHDEYGNTADFTPTSTVTIGRYINGQQVGFITIPSANNINYESVPFNHIEITPNQIVIPAESMPGSKQYVLELYSPEKYPFISANGVLLSDYAGNITANAYLTGNAVISPTGAPQAGYLMRVEAVQPGIFELVHPEHLSFAPANLLGNHYTTANFEVAVRDKYGAILSGVPVSLSVAAGGGAVTPNSTTSNAMYTHGAAGSATINGQYAALTADLPVITLADDDPPVITLDQPTDINNAPITHNIIFTVSDADSGIASWSFWFAGEDRTASLSVTGSGQFEYAPNFALDTTYAITISASDLVGNATTITRDIHTKMDTDGPVILAYPAPGTRNVLPEEPLSFRIQDFESGVRADSLQLLVSTADGQVLSLTPITESPDAHTLLVTYNHPDFELGTTVSVTLNIKDISGNESSLTYSYTIALDSTPPTVAILAPSQGESTSNVVTLSFTVSDKTSDIDLNSLEVWLTTTTANSSTVKIDAASINILPQDNAKQLTANVLLTLEYGAQVIVNVRAKDDCGIEGSATLNFQTIPDTTAPAIQIISPAPDTTVSLNTPIIIEVTDTETGVNLSWLALQVNGTILAPHTPPVPISNGYRAEYRPALNYQSQAAVIVSVRDNAYPQTNLNTLSYAFQIEADTYPPEKPTLNAITGIATNNFNALYIPLSGEVEPDNDLLIYINDVKITENYYSASEFKLTLNVQELKTKLQLASAPATLHITAVARDRAQIPNASQASAPTRAVVLVDNYFADAGFSGVEVFVPAGTFAEDITINIASPNPGTYELPDNLTMVYIIDISAPANRQPVGNGKVRITLPLPATGNNYDVYHYDEQRAEWSKIESRVSGDTIVFESNQLSLFGIGSINNATQLAEYEMILAPNPVKLASEPLHFVYKVPHNSSAEVRIYTINGRLLSKFNKDLFTGLNEFTWTGENNFNETIGNGVYLVYIRIEDQITGEKKIIRSKIAVLN
ncbi:MAG: T9SS type A sorting domain-containing protein, partial [Candidatus Margulisbacteria bacterium]|nr:T9SS type A sorting domain-containing protein [Candidatus Margulisiibacteriota bacterium]